MTHFSIRPRLLSYCARANQQQDTIRKKPGAAGTQSQEQSSSSPSSNAYHFPFGVHAHGDVDELLVEERHADLQAPGRGRLVGAQAVVLVQSFDLQILASGSDSDAMRSNGRWRAG